MTPRPRAVAGGAAVVAATAILAAGCGSGASYVANERHEIYVKLPGDWTALSIDEQGEQGEPADPDALPWQIIFDRSDNPTIEHFSSEVPDEPVGLIGAIEPSAGVRDALSLSVLRSYSMGADPIELAQTGTMSLQMLGSVDDYDVNGNHGNRVRFQFVPEVGGPTVVIDQVAVTDPGRTRVYVIQVKCELKCFEDHVSEIDDIIDSFHIGGE